MCESLGNDTEKAWKLHVFFMQDSLRVLCMFDSLKSHEISCGIHMFFSYNFRDIIILSHWEQDILQEKKAFTYQTPTWQKILLAKHLDARQLLFRKM